MQVLNKWNEMNGNGSEIHTKKRGFNDDKIVVNLPFQKIYFL